jgi:hypothetical protein
MAMLSGDNISREDAALCADFQSFMLEGGATPPTSSVKAVRTIVSNDLSPSPWRVLSRLMVIVASTGGVTLVFCPHMGLGYGDMFGLMKYIMPLGDGVCQAICGSIFVGSGALLASMFLRPEELAVIRSYPSLQFAAVSAVVLGLFFCAGAATLSLLGFFWFVGAVIGGLVSFELGFRGRFIYLELVG